MFGRRATLAVIAFLTLSPVCWPQATSETARRLLDVRPASRLTGRIDLERRVRLTGNRYPSARPENLLGEVPGDQRLDRMVLTFRMDAAQQEGLRELIEAQQDPESPYYHRWVTPEAFGQRFGISESDLAQVANWLESQGMAIDEIPASHRAIVFSGAAGHVERAFHTQMRRYMVSGEAHYANATDPEIPAALADVVEGIVSLHDFRSAPAKSAMGAIDPAYTLASGVTLLMPRDSATIYDVLPLYGQGLDGTGQSIAVVGRTDLSLTDVRTFRTNAGLPANDPQKIFVNGVNPGMPDCQDEAESALDVEWAGAIAKNATVKFVSVASSATDGVILAAQYAVNNNVAPIVTVSYLHCENTLSDGGQSLWGALWSQAAAQGQTIFVASGDSGAAGCDLAIAKTATQGKAVNAICSSPNATCVGGTQFNDVFTPSLYWTATNGAGQASALSYIPELAWNETGWSGMINTATGGGISTVYPKPSWQSAPGVPAGNLRLVPDIAASSAVHDAYVIQVQGKPFYIAGTSAAAPSVASVMALVLQNSGARLGNVNPALYTLATQQASAGPAVFHDITSGNNSVPGVTGYTAGAGYDPVTGLGSVDAFLLVNSWSNSKASNFALSVSAPSLTVAPGSTKTATLTMSPQGGFNAPVTLSSAGVPVGITVGFSSQTLSAAAPVTMTVAAAANAAAGVAPLTVIAAGGGVKRTLAFSVTVPAPTFTLGSATASLTIAPGGSMPVVITTAAGAGFQSAISLSVNGAPQGVTASFSPASIASPGSGTTSLTIGATAAAVPGTYTLTITATGGSVTKTQNLNVTVLSPSFMLMLSGTSVSVAPGGSIPISVTTIGATGFKSAVSLSVSGLPNGVNASFSPAAIASPGGGTSMLTISAGSSALVGSYALTVTAVGGGFTKVQTLTLAVVSPSFTLAPTALSMTVAAASSKSIGLTAAALNGFKSTISLSASGLPKGVTATFAPGTIAAPGNGIADLTISVAPGTPVGTCTLTVTATGGGVTKTQAIGLTY